MSDPISGTFCPGCRKRLIVDAAVDRLVDACIHALSDEGMNVLSQARLQAALDTLKHLQERNQWRAI